MKIERRELWELILVSSFIVLDLEHVHLNVVRNISSWWGYFLLVFVFTMLFVLQTWNSPPSTFCLTTCISLLHFVKNLSVNLQRNNEGCSMASVLHFSYILPEYLCGNLISKQYFHCCCFPWLQIKHYESNSSLSLLSLE